MPIPLLFIGVAAVTGAFGVGKSVKAGIDIADANSTNKSADEIVKNATAKIEKCRKNCGDAIENLGERKVQVLNGSIKSFIQEFEKLKNIELKESSGLNELQKLVLDRGEFEELKELQSMATSIAGGLASGALAGAVTAFGAFGAAGALATASTGTAIATLSGAAATNATLAFFGGGSLAAGGLGMAGGAAVLGGLVAGPALAVLGLVVGAKASKNRDEAYTNLAKAVEFKEQMDAAASLCIGIRKRANMFYRFLLSLNAVFEPLIFEMGQTIKMRGTDYRDFSEDEKKTVVEAMAIAGAIKSILDTPILDDDGNLTEASGKIEELVSVGLNGLEDKKHIVNDESSFNENYGDAITKDNKEGELIKEIKQFICSTVNTLNEKCFEDLKTRLTGDYITFSVLDKNEVSADVYSEKLCDYFEKLEFKTSDTFEELLEKYLSDWDSLVEDSIISESTPSEEGQPQTVTRAKKYYSHAIEIKEAGNISIKQVSEFSRIMMCLYMAIIEKDFAEIDDFDYAIQCIDLDRILDAMHQKKTDGFLMFGGGAKFDTSDRYSMDTGFFVLTIIMYYHIQNQQKSE